MTALGKSFFSACGCPIPRRRPSNNLCMGCGGNIVGGVLPPPPAERPEFRNDHGPHCTCFDCVMRRRTGSR